jgi:uncharacterized RDD family membrane protein YckC
MLCVRCSHPLPARADRCLRCFALNPPSEPVVMGAPRGEQTTDVFDMTSEPPVEMAMSIESDPPPQSGSFRIAPETPAPLVLRAAPDTDPDPVELTMPNPARIVAPKTVPFAKPKNLMLPFFEQQLPVARDPFPVSGFRLPAEEVTSVAPAILSAPAIVSEPMVISDPEVIFSEPMVMEAPAPAAAPARAAAMPRAAVVRASGSSRLAAWGIDASLLASLVGLQILLAAQLTNHDFIDLALSRPLFPFWLVLVACDAITCSWLFAAAGRTPGMFVLHQRLRTLDGGSPSPGDALQRALLSLLSAAPALFGFSFALFDSRGQTLHDKLCGCIVTVD